MFVSLSFPPRIGRFVTCLLMTERDSGEGERQRDSERERERERGRERTGLTVLSTLGEGVRGTVERERRYV